MMASSIQPAHDRLAQWARRPAGPVLLLLLVALLTRAWLLGNPVIHIDEQFYLLVGERMRSGAMPYIDIWDRKPLGLFVLYEAFGALTPGSVLGYQLAAFACALAGGWLVFRLATRVAPVEGALIAGLAYLLYLAPFNGSGGQSPIFYNPLMLIAGGATWRIGMTQRPGGLALRGAVVMLLVGLAMQVKYTALFEGMFFGMALMWRSWRDGRSHVATAAMTVLWVACALIPTAAAIGSYAAVGQAEAFIQANFLSIFGRKEEALPGFGRLLLAAAALTPFWIAIWKSRHATQAQLFPRLWAGFAIGGYLLFGSYYDHYALPLLGPLAILAAPAWASGRLRWLVLGLGGVLSAAALIAVVLGQGTAGQLNAMTATIAPRLNGGCLYVYEGEPALYRTTRSCLPTKFIFPSHFNNVKEAKALAVDVPGELRKVLATRPSVIVMSDKARRVSNPVTRALLIDHLKRHYRQIAALPIGSQTRLIFVRKP